MGGHVPMLRQILVNVKYPWKSTTQGKAHLHHLEVLNGPRAPAQCRAGANLIAGCQPHRPTGASAPRQHLVDVAPPPLLARLEGPDHGVDDGPKVSGRVPARGVVTASDVTTREAFPQVDPIGRAEGQAVLAPLGRLRGWISLCRREVLAGRPFLHRPSVGRSAGAAGAGRMKITEAAYGVDQAPRDDLAPVPVRRRS